MDAMVDTGGSQAKTAARSRKQPPRHAPGRTLGAFLVAALFCADTLYYLTWRLTVTNWTLWWLGVPLLLAELFSIFSTLGLLYTTWPRPHPPIHASLDPSTLPVFVLIPTVNEGVGVVEPTLRGAFAARTGFAPGGWRIAP